MDELGAFMGVAHDLTGDVWIYKPTATPPGNGNGSTDPVDPTDPTDPEITVPEPGILSLLGFAAILFGLFSFFTPIGGMRARLR